MMGCPNTAVPLPRPSPQEVMSSITNDNDQLCPTSQHTFSVGGVGAGGSHQQMTGRGNPMVNFPRLPSQNVAPPLHSPGEYQYRFIQIPGFPIPNNNQQRRANQSVAAGGRPPPAPPTTTSSSQRSYAMASEQFTNLNRQDSPALTQQPQSRSQTFQYHMESTV